MSRLAVVWARVSLVTLPLAGYATAYIWMLYAMGWLHGWTLPGYISLLWLQTGVGVCGALAAHSRRTVIGLSLVGLAALVAWIQFGQQIYWERSEWLYIIPVAAVWTGTAASLVWLASDALSRRSAG